MFVDPGQNNQKPAAPAAVTTFTERLSNVLFWLTRHLKHDHREKITPSSDYLSEFSPFLLKQILHDDEYPNSALLSGPGDDAVSLTSLEIPKKEIPIHLFLTAWSQHSEEKS